MEALPNPIPHMQPAGMHVHTGLKDSLLGKRANSASDTSSISLEVDVEPMSEQDHTAVPMANFTAEPRLARSFDSPRPGIELSWCRDYSIQIRVYESLLRHFMNQAAVELERQPVLDTDRGKVSLKNVVITPVPGGVYISCEIDAEAHTAVTDSVGLVPKVSGSLSVPFSPLIIHNGQAMLSIHKPEIKLTEDHRPIVRRSFEWVRDAIHLEAAIQQVVNGIAASQLDGKSIIDLALQHAETSTAQHGIMTALRYVDPNSARGAIHTSPHGDVVLDVMVQPTSHAKRVALTLLIAIGIILIALIIGLGFAIA